jgi:hypothetical protein
MATQYYGAKLSDNMRVHPNGNLICENAEIARTGFQIYKGHELPQDELEAQGIEIDPDADVKVLRTADEVFKANVIRSFNGTTFTCTHPDKLLTVDTNADHDCGDVMNVRRGEEPLSDGNWPLLADIVVKDAEAIRQITQEGVRELSCGYNYHILKQGNNLLMTNIIGNHVALVEKGRAGAGARLMDTAMPDLPKRKIPMSKFDSVIRAMGFKEWAKNAPPEDIADHLENNKVHNAVAFDSAQPVTAGHPVGCFCAACKPVAAVVAQDATTAMDDKRIMDAVKRVLDSKEEEQKAMDKEDKAALSELASILETGNVSAADKADAKDGMKPDGEEDDEEDGEGNDSDEDDNEAEDEASPEIPEADRFAPVPGTATDAALDEAYNAGIKAGQKRFLKAFKPLVAKSKDKMIRGAFDTAAKTITSRPKGNKGGYAAIAAASQTRSKEANDSMASGDAMKKATELANAAYKARLGVNATKK